MKHDVNILLLGLLVFILMAMAVMAIYAQNEYKKLGDEYSVALKNLSEKNRELDNRSKELMIMQVELENREASLKDLVDELNLSKERQESLGGFFEDLKGVKETLEENLSKTEAEKQDFESKYNSKVKELNVCNTNAKIKDEQLMRERAKTAQLLTQMNLMSYDLNRTAADLAKTQTQMLAVESKLDELNDKLSALESKVRKLSTPDQISESAQDDVIDELNDLEAYCTEDIQAAIDAVQSSLAAMEDRL